MTLLSEIFGVVFGGVVVASLVRLPGSRSSRRAAGVALVVAGVTSLLFFENVWALGSSFLPSIRTNEVIPRQTAEVTPGTGTNTAFLAWVRSKLIDGHVVPTFWLTPASSNTGSLVYQWSTYQLLPARETDLMQEANWIVFYGVNPASAYYDHSAFGRLIVYAPDYAVAQRTNVG